MLLEWRFELLGGLLDEYEIDKPTRHLAQQICEEIYTFRKRSMNNLTQRIKQYTLKESGKMRSCSAFKINKMYI